MYKIVYISDFFYDTLDKELEAVVRGPVSLRFPVDHPTTAIQDPKAKIEFRRLKNKKKIVIE